MIRWGRRTFKKVHLRPQVEPRWTTSFETSETRYQSYFEFE
jgi:hypothetical protein